METGERENEENPVIKNEDGLKAEHKKTEVAQNAATTDSTTGASPAKRRGRPPKTAATTTPSPIATEKEGGATEKAGAGRGRKRAAANQDPASDPSTAAINVKIPKQTQQKEEGTKRQIDLQR